MAYYLPSLINGLTDQSTFSNCLAKTKLPFFQALRGEYDQADQLKVGVVYTAVDVYNPT